MNSAFTFPDWLQVDFNGSKTLNEIDIFTVQDNWQNPLTPTDSMTFSVFGLTGFDVQYWNGSAWTTIPGGSVTGNNKVWRKFTFTPITTTKIRVLTNASVDGYSRITELEAWQNGSSGTVHWLVTDQLGTPRMVLDQTGALANVKRHDTSPSAKNSSPRPAAAPPRKATRPAMVSASSSPKKNETLKRSWTTSTPGITRACKAALRE